MSSATGAAAQGSPSSETDALVVFTPSGRRARVPVGTPLLQAARSLGVDIDSVCGGRGLCGRCQVLLAEGDFAKHGVTSRAENLSPFGAVEQEFCRHQPLAPGRRLSCSTQVLGDVVIDVPSDSQVHRQVVRKAAEAHDIELDPVVRLHYVEVAPPDMHDPSGDLRRLEDALDFEWRLTGLACDVRVLQQLQPALRQGAWKVTVAVHGGSQIIAVWPGFRERVYGIAIDVGSTTIAAHLCDLSSGEVVAAAGAMNPQIRFGEDLMSRVSWVMMNPGGEKELTRLVRGAINELAADVTRQAGVAPEDILEATFVGNPIMHHLLLGISPVELGGAPFALATDSALTLWATEIDFAIHRNARIYVLPCIAGHVGADAAGVVLAERPDLADEMTLLVDIGTNAEIVLGNRHRLLACSSPTGPAFEGAQISCGQRAAPGAIERVRIDPATLEPRVRVIGCDLWSDEAGFAAATAATGVTGICGSGIIEVVAELYLAGVIRHDGTIDGGLALRSSRIRADGRTWAYLLHAGAEGRAPLCHHAERRARDPARQGGALRRRAAPDGAPRCRPRGPHPSRRGLRQPCRRQVRDGAGHDSGLRARQRQLGRQRRGHRRPHCAARPAHARDRRRPRAPDREDRDGCGTEVSGVLRRGDGHPASHRTVYATARCGTATGARAGS